MLAALTTGSKIGLGVSGLAFVVFALVSAMWIPRKNPNFPGRRLGWYVFVTFLFFVGMMCAVIFFSHEKEEPAEPREAAALVYRVS